MQNSTRPGQFSTRPAKNALALASGRALVSLTAALLELMAWHKDCTVSCNAMQFQQE